MSHPFHYGGQAVLAGVMIRGKHHMAVAVRRPDGQVATKVEPLGRFSTSAWARVPLLRGVVVLWDTLVLGMKAMIYSANVSLGQEEEKISWSMVVGMAITALFLVAVLFFTTPMLLARWLDVLIPSAFWNNVVEGLFRLGVLVAYLRAISFMGEIKDVFAYHGAEHKAINAYEEGRPLTVQAAQSHSTTHGRCGTAFILIVLLVAVLIFALLGRPPFWLRLLSRIALIPLIAAISYELLRLGAEHLKNAVVKALFAPGLALQALTTREPSDEQVEVALTALETALQADAETELGQEKLALSASAD